jgi:hypothetical protein
MIVKCRICHSPIDNELYTSCKSCRDKNNKQHRDIRTLRKNMGLCPKCGKQPITDTVYCSNCRKAPALARMMLYQSRKQNKLCVDCGNVLKSNENYRCPKCKIRHNTKVKSDAHHLRAKIINHYGAKCICCGEVVTEFLELDHVNSNGAEHRKLIGKNSETLCRWIVSNNYPSIIQLLCSNCNRAKSHYGTCPHQLEPSLPTTNRKRHWRELRIRIIDHYGKQCICCGESNWAFLELDHTNGDGAIRHKNGEHIYVILETLPSDIQLLCSNCNKAKWQHGNCPHHPHQQS